MQKRLETKIYN